MRWQADLQAAVPGCSRLEHWLPLAGAAGCGCCCVVSSCHSRCHGQKRKGPQAGQQGQLQLPPRGAVASCHSAGSQRRSRRRKDATQCGHCLPFQYRLVNHHQCIAIFSVDLPWCLPSDPAMGLHCYNYHRWLKLSQASSKCN